MFLLDKISREELFENVEKLEKMLDELETTNLRKGVGFAP